MAVVDRVRELCLPILDELGLELFDLERHGGRIVVSVDRDGGVDLDAIAEATRRISRALDEHDPVPGTYTLEVSSPGLERRLRTPEHHRWAVGRQVRIKLRPGLDGDRRIDGTVVEADDAGVTVRPEGGDAGDRRIPYDDIEKARTVFEWGPAPKPGRAKRSKASGPTTSGPGGRTQPGRAENTEAKVES